MQTPPSASPSSQAMNSANNNHMAQTPELFPSSLSAARYAPPRLRRPNDCTPSSLAPLSASPPPFFLPSVPNLNSDLFDLQPVFIPAVSGTPSISTANSAWGGRHANTHRAGGPPLHPWSC